MRNQQVEFSLIDYSGEDTANDATFYIHDNPITGNLFQSAEPGTYEVYATYNVAGALTSSEVREFSIYIPRRYLMSEDYAGTCCAYSLAVIEDIDRLVDDIE